MVSEDTWSVSYEWSGITDYEITFDFILTSDIYGIYRDTLGSEIDLVQGVDFEISTLGPANFFRPFSDYGTGGVLLVYREVDYLQMFHPNTDLPINKSGLENALDKMVWMIQQVRGFWSRAVIAPIGEAQIVIPTISERRGRFSAWEDSADAPFITADGVSGVPISSILNTFISSVSLANARAALELSYSEISALREAAMRMIILNGDTALSEMAIGRYFIPNQINITIPSSPEEGDIIELNTDTQYPVKIMQPSSENKIIYPYFGKTTKGTDGYLCIFERNNYIRLLFIGGYTEYNAIGGKLSDPSVLPTGPGVSVQFSTDGSLLAVAHSVSPYLTVYRVEGSTLTKLSDPSVLPTGTGRSVQFSPDGSLLAVRHDSSPYFSVYRVEGSTLTKLSDPSVLPTGTCNYMQFSPDGSLLALSHAGSPYLSVYRVEGATLTKIADPSVLPTGNGNSVQFSPDGSLIAVAHGTSPYLTVYRVEGSTLTKLSDPSVLPTGTGSGVQFSPDGSLLAVRYLSSPYFSVYRVEYATLTKLSDPSVLPTNICSSVQFSTDGSLLAVGYLSSPYLIVYRVEGSTLTKLSDPSVSPTGTGYSVQFSTDGSLLAVVHSGSPYLTVYRVEGSTLTKLSDPSVLPTGTGRSVQFLPDRSLLAVGHDTSPYFSVYSMDGEESEDTWQVLELKNIDKKSANVIFR
jgi:WD40 repeat protein